MKRFRIKITEPNNEPRLVDYACSWCETRPPNADDVRECTAIDGEHEPIKIGQALSSTIRLENDRQINRMHAMIAVLIDGTLRVIDLGSTYGTYATSPTWNGEYRITTTRLEKPFGSRVRVGSTWLDFLEVGN